MATVKRAQASAAAAPLIILLLIGAAVIFYVISIPPAEREKLLGTGTTETGTPSGSYSNTLLDEKPGFINGVSPTSKKFVHTLGSVVVDGGPQPQKKTLSTQFLVRRNLISDVSADFNFNVESKADLANANLEMLVTDRTEKGELIVTLNEKVVYTSTVNAGQQLVVALPADSIVQGLNNLKIYAAGPGLRFWTTNSYSLSGINLILGIYTGEKAVQTQGVTLSTEELQGIKAAKYDAFIRQTSDKSAELKLSVNGEQVYKFTPSGATAFSLDLPPEQFKGANSIELSVGRDGTYSVEFPKLTVSATTTTGDVKTYAFTTTTGEIANLDSETCEITVAGAAMTGTTSVGEFAMPFAIDAWGYAGWGDCSTQDRGKSWADQYCQAKSYESAKACYHKSITPERWKWAGTAQSPLKALTRYCPSAKTCRHHPLQRHALACRTCFCHLCLQKPLLQYLMQLLLSS